MRNKWMRNLFWYVLLLTGMSLLYYIHIERWFYPTLDEEATSKIDFVYQQF